jgi:hypothetical protein
MLALLASAIAGALIPTPALGSTGHVLIGVIIEPSSVVTINAGGNVSLYFGQVTWSGGQFYLLISADGFSQKSTGDVAYSATFNINDLVASAITAVSTSSGKWSVGYKWINGSIPKDIGGGKYYIKAFDGSAAQLAVTDTYLSVIGSLEVTPTSGPGGRNIVLKGYAFTPNNRVNLTYYNPIDAKNHTLLTAMLLTDNVTGQFTYSLTAPDLGQVGTTGELAIANNIINFWAIDNSSKLQYKANYTEYRRGLEQVNGLKPASGNLFGNATDFSLTVSVGVGKPLIIAGKYFNPSNITLWWDGTTQIGSTSANQTGQFNITLTVPITGKGNHVVVIKDAKVTNFRITVKVIPSIILSPVEGPVGTTVTVTGYGFTPAGTDSKVYNVTTSWDSPAKDLVWAWTDANGHFVNTFVAPHAPGGNHNVTATENVTAIYAKAIFKITPQISVSPSTVTNNGTEVTVTGTGLDPAVEYDLDLANQKDFSPIKSDTAGDLKFTFYAGGFQAGSNVIVLYNMNGWSVGAKTIFTVNESSVVLTKLDEINTALTNLDSFIRTDSTSLHTLLTSIQSAVADAKSALTAQISGLSTQLTTIETYAQTASTQAATAASSAATAATAATAAKTAAEGASSSTSTISIAVYGAIVLALIAALASIVAVITLQKKVA